MNEIATLDLTGEHSSAAFPKAVGRAFEDLFALPAMDTTRLLLVNHAEPESGAISTNGREVDPALSENGRCQAMRLAMRFRSYQIDAVYTSTARAALETARLVAATRDLPMTRVPQLREIGFDDAATSSHGSEKNAAAEALIRFINRPRWDALRGFETSRHFRHRVVQAIEGIIGRHTGQDVVVVTHGGVINAYLSMVLDIPRDMFFLPEHASISELRSHHDLYGLQKINDVAHLMTTFSPQ